MVISLKDEKILSALESIHLQPAKPWTIESLAASIGISRATLANRFKKKLLAPLQWNI